MGEVEATSPSRRTGRPVEPVVWFAVVAAVVVALVTLFAFQGQSETAAADQRQLDEMSEQLDELGERVGQAEQAGQ